MGELQGRLGPSEPSEQAGVGPRAGLEGERRNGRMRDGTRKVEVGEQEEEAWGRMGREYESKTRTTMQSDALHHSSYPEASHQLCSPY